MNEKFKKKYLKYKKKYLSIQKNLLMRGGNYARYTKNKWDNINVFLDSLTDYFNDQKVQVFSIINWQGQGYPIVEFTADNLYEKLFRDCFHDINGHSEDLLKKLGPTLKDHLAEKAEEQFLSVKELKNHDDRVLYDVIVTRAMNDGNQECSMDGMYKKLLHPCPQGTGTCYYNPFYANPFILERFALKKGQPLGDGDVKILNDHGGPIKYMTGPMHDSSAGPAGLTPPTADQMSHFIQVNFPKAQGDVPIDMNANQFNASQVPIAVKKLDGKGNPFYIRQNKYISDEKKNMVDQGKDIVLVKIIYNDRPYYYLFISHIEDNKYVLDTYLHAPVPPAPRPNRAAGAAGAAGGVRSLYLTDFNKIVAQGKMSRIWDNTTIENNFAATGMVQLNFLRQGDPLGADAPAPPPPPCNATRSTWNMAHDPPFIGPHRFIFCLIVHSIMVQMIKTLGDFIGNIIAIARELYILNNGDKPRLILSSNDQLLHIIAKDLQMKILEFPPLAQPYPRPGPPPNPPPNPQPNYKPCQIHLVQIAKQPKNKKKLNNNTDTRPHLAIIMGKTMDSNEYEILLLRLFSLVEKSLQYYKKIKEGIAAGRVKGYLDSKNLGLKRKKMVDLPEHTTQGPGRRRVNATKAAVAAGLLQQIIAALQDEPKNDPDLEQRQFNKLFQGPMSALVSTKNNRDRLSKKLDDTLTQTVLAKSKHDFFKNCLSVFAEKYYRNELTAYKEDFEDTFYKLKDIAKVQKIPLPIYFTNPLSNPPPYLDLTRIQIN